MLFFFFFFFFDNDTEPLAESSTAFITIRNQTNEIKAFKIKTTAPKLYCVRPNAAIIQPGEAIKISVIFLGLPQEPKEDYKCRDKFLVIVLPAPYKIDSNHTVSEIWNDLENEFKSQAIQKKIKVVHNNSIPKIPSIATNEQDKNERKTQNISSTYELKHLEQESKDKKVNSEKGDKSKENVETIKPNTTSNKEETSFSAEQSQQHITAKISPSTMLFIAIVVLVLGWLYY